MRSKAERRRASVQVWFKSARRSPSCAVEFAASMISYVSWLHMLLVGSRLARQQAANSKNHRVGRAARLDVSMCGLVLLRLPEAEYIFVSALWCFGVLQACSWQHGLGFLCKCSMLAAGRMAAGVAV